MSKPEKITEDQLLAMIDEEVSQAYGYGDGRLEQLRRRNEYYFMAEAKEDLAPPEIQGRSKVVDTTVRNTVLGIEGPLMKTFYGSDNIFEFEETKPGPEAEQQAKNVSEYVNYIFRKKNDGYMITNTWIREALNIKLGIIKVWWDPSDIETREEYYGQTIEQLTILMDDPEVTIVEQKPYPDEDAARTKQKTLEQASQQLQQMQQAAAQVAQPPQQPGMPPSPPPAVVQYQQALAQFQQMEATPVPDLYDVVMKRVKTGGKVCIENVPPEEFLISKRAKSIKTASWCGHRFIRTFAQLKAAGYKLPDDLSGDDDSAEFNSLRMQRFEYLEDDPYLTDDAMEKDPSQRKVWVVESYMQVDWDGDGIPEWRKIVKCGRTMLANDEFDEPPFVALGSILVPHILFGLCPADLAIESQKIMTSLKRGQLDNIYMQVNGRTVAVEGQVNLDDLLSNVPGGIVRAKNKDAVAPLQQGIGDIAGSIQLMQIFDDAAQESTGWTRRSQGGNGLQLQQTATQANITTNREDMRVESISRYMAETGFTELGYMILKLVSRYQKKAEMVKLSGGWVNVDPREWTNHFNLNVNVGLGTGNKDQLVQHLMLTGQKQEAGLALGIATPENIFNLNRKLCNALGFKNGEEFFSDPAKQPPKGPPPDDPSVQVAKIKAGSDQQSMQQKAQQADADRQHQAQLEQFKAQVEAESRMAIDRNKQQAEAEQKLQEIQNQAQLDAMRMQYEHDREMAKMAGESEQRELDRYKIDQDNATKVLVAQITAQQKQDAALIAAETAADNTAAEANNGNN